MEESERKERDPTPKSKEHAGDPGPGASTSAASQRGAAAAADTNAPGDERIDVCSENFDPLAALYAPTVRIPVPNIKCFNNVAEYESFLKGGRGRAKPENVEKKRRKAMKGVADPERIARLKSLMVNNPVPETEDGEGSSKPRERKRHKTPKNVLTRMPLCKGSPLGELYRCVEEKIRVKVHIRTFKGLRGVCSGFVVAFDKFWNMAMVDVDETYREPLLGEAYYHEKALTISRLFEKLKIQESSEADEPATEDAAQEGTGKRLSADPKMASKSLSVHTGGEAEAKLSDVIGAKQDKGGTSLKERQKKDCRTYGKVHTRHINQLFIRGENVVLVNPQPL